MISAFTLNPKIFLQTEVQRQLDLFPVNNFKIQRREQGSNPFSKAKGSF